MLENPEYKSEMEVFEDGKIEAYCAMEAAAELCRYLEQTLDVDAALDLQPKVWALFGKAYMAGRLNPVAIVPASPDEVDS